MILTEANIQTAYEDLALARQTLYDVGDKLAEAKAAYDKEVLVAIDAGQIVGKNQGERDACADRLFGHLKLAVDENQKRYDASRLLFDLSNNIVEMLRLMVRYRELD